MEKKMKTSNLSWELNAVYAMWYRQTKRFWRTKPRLISSIIQPLFFLVIFGVGFGSALNLTSMGVSKAKLAFSDFLAPGIIAMSVFTTAIMGGASVIWDRDFGYLKEVLVAPVSRKSTILGRSLGDATVATMQGIIIMTIAAFIVSSFSLTSCLIAIPVMLLVALLFASIGVTIASMLKSIEGFQLIMSLLTFPMFFLSGAFFPVFTPSVPVWMKIAAIIDPLTYGVDLLRGLLTGMNSLSLMLDFAILMFLTGLMIVVSASLFDRRGIE